MADRDVHHHRLRRSRQAALCWQGLEITQTQFPGFEIWQELAGDRMRYIARRTSPGSGLHTVVTADLGELQAA